MLMEANMLKREDCGLVLVDVQGSLARMVQNSSLLVANTVKLIQCCKALSLPILWLEQNPKGLGETIPELAQHLSGVTHVNEKYHFNALLEEPIKQTIIDTGKKQWLVAGIEAHVCVYQTVSGLLEQDFQVEVVSDCVSSRAQENIDLAVKKMQLIGANITSVEMAIFELMKSAKRTEFKEVLAIIK